MSSTFHLLGKGVMVSRVRKDSTQRWVSIESSGVHPGSRLHFQKEPLVGNTQSTTALDSLS